MLNIAKDIDSLSNFKRNTQEFMRRMKKSGHPVVLTVNGKAEIVVQSAENYQKMLEAVERLEAIESIQAGLTDIKTGSTRPASEVHAAMRRKHEISD